MINAIKAFIGGHFVLDLSERRRLGAFESEFGMPVWYACYGRYLEEMEAPKTIIDTLVSTGSGEMTWIEDGLGGPADGLRMYRAPSYAEWLAASCGPWTYEEHKALTQLLAKDVLKGLTPQIPGTYCARTTTPRDAARQRQPEAQL